MTQAVAPHITALSWSPEYFTALSWSPEYFYPGNSWISSWKVLLPAQMYDVSGGDRRSPFYLEIFGVKVFWVKVWFLSDNLNFKIT